MEAEWTVVVHEAAEGGYWAEVEELPGCFASGDTRDELEADLQGAIETCLTAVDEISTGEDAVGTDEKGSPRPRPGEGAPMPLSQEFPNYRERRRELRQNATLAENLLWR